MLQPIEGKVALVTGSSRGLGFRFAQALAQHGCRVVLNGRNKDGVEQAAKSLRDAGLEASAMPFDIVDEKQTVEAIAAISADVGDIGILINNAGIQIRRPLEEFELDDWHSIVNGNLTGAFLVTREVVKGMIARQEGKIVNICSLQSELGRRTIAPYAASKGGLKMLTRAMAVEWACHNIQINGIAPGYFRTEMTEPLAQDEDFDKWLKNRTPARRWGDPEELIGPLLMLCSPSSSFVNGQVLFVDGGLSIGV